MVQASTSIIPNPVRYEQVRPAGGRPPHSGSLVTDARRDTLLTDFGKATLQDRYLLPGESFQDLFARVARAYADDASHAQRLYDYMSKLWFMPSTPILSNGGTQRGLPISCFLNAVNDSLDSIVASWTENVWLASHGGGIGTYWGGVRSIGEPVKGNGQTSGIIPFVRVMDSLTLAISQGSLRRGSAAVYLDIHHPEIEEFIEIRKPSGDFQSQEPQSAPRRRDHRRVYAGRKRRSAISITQPVKQRANQDRISARAVAKNIGNTTADRRALFAIQRYGQSTIGSTSARTGT